MQNTRLALDATRCDLDGEALRVDGRYERQDVGMAGCQDSSQLRVTYITNDCGLWRNEKERERERGARRVDRGQNEEEETRASTDAPAICWWSDAAGVASFVKPSICRSRGSITIF